MSKFFPLFVNLEDKKILVVGAGKIATRRIKTLLEFNANITIIATDFGEDVDWKKACVTTLKREYKDDDTNNFDIVLACTNNRELNHSIYLECKQKGIMINVCDKKEECDFFFPAVVSEQEDVIGICGNGKDHHQTKKLADNVRALREKIFKS